VVTGDKGYDSEENHILVRELLHGFSIIPTRYERVPIYMENTRKIQKTNETWIL
jgi:hypothetical protein